MPDDSFAFLGPFAPYLSAGGTLLSAFGQQQMGSGYLEHGIAQNVAAQFAAAQLRQNANTVQGAAQRQAYAIGRQGEYIRSAQIAQAAASGGSATDPTVVNIMARTQADIGLRQATALYGGQARARELGIEAAAAEWSGQEELRVAKRAYMGANIGALSTLARGGVSLYENYGGGGPPPG